MEKRQAQMKILAYGINKVGFAIPQNPLMLPNGIQIDFQPFDTRTSFHDYDGVIMFQGIWARWQENNSPFADSDAYLVDKQEDEMSKRIKQLHLLLKKSGFVCFLMDRMGYDDYDLAKTVLGWFASTHHEGINSIHALRPKYGELTKYLEKYGVAKTKYSHYGEADYRILANFGDYDSNVAICFDRQIFYIPYHCPDKTAQDTEDLFKLLLPALISIYKKLNQEIPKWVDEYVFEQESKLISTKEDLQKRFSDVEKEIGNFKDIKKILCYSGELLKEAVVKVFTDNLKFKVQDEENWKEDFNLTSKTDKGEQEIKAVVETKGVNENVTREYVNQVDSHRDRNSLPTSTAGILITNTFMKYSSLEEKDKPLHSDQVKHSISMNVLILRTLDLIRALNIILKNPEKLVDFKKLLLTESGWLEVKEDSFILHKT